MRSPCTRECPERKTGEACFCEKKQAWEDFKEQRRRERQREALLDGYQRDAKYDSKTKHLHRNRRVP